MAQIHTERNVYFDPLQVVYDIISQNVLDPNPDRRERTSEGERKWIFPTTPEANDENYPRIAIIHGRVSFEEWTAGQFLEYEIDKPQKLVRAINTTIARIPVTVAVFCKKTRHKALEVVDYNGDKRYVENSAQAAWLVDKIQHELLKNRIKFIEKDIDIVVKDAEASYEDNDFLWAGDIACELIMKNIWTEDIPQIIANIGLSLTVDVGPAPPTPISPLLTGLVAVYDFDGTSGDGV